MRKMPKGSQAQCEVVVIAGMMSSRAAHGLIWAQTVTQIIYLGLIFFEPVTKSFGIGLVWFGLV